MCVVASVSECTLVLLNMLECWMIQRLPRVCARPRTQWQIILNRARKVPSGGEGELTWCAESWECVHAQHVWVRPGFLQGQPPAFRGMWVAEMAGKVKKIVQILDQEVAATALPKAATT